MVALAMTTIPVTALDAEDNFFSRIQQLHNHNILRKSYKCYFMIIVFNDGVVWDSKHYDSLKLMFYISV